MSNADLHLSATMRGKIEQWEGCPPTVYHGGADRPGLLSGGFGHTGPEVDALGLGAPVSRELADKWFQQDAYKFEAGVKDEIMDYPTTQGQFDALFSLAYNVGLGNERKSTVLREHCAGNYQAAADAFQMWDKANGVDNDGLLARRQEEAQVYFDASPGV
jgi:lysozyme